MKKMKTINNAHNLNPEELNADNYQLMGITNSGQLLFDKELNQYRESIDEADEQQRCDFHINGTTTRKFNCLYGQVNLKKTVLRKKGFYPTFIKPWQRDAVEVEQLVFNSFMDGSSTRKIERGLKEMGIDCSRSKVSRISRHWRESVKETQQRDLSETDFCMVSLDATYVDILSSDPDSKHYEKKPVFRALGLNSETGYWELLSLKAYEKENTACYSDFLNDLKKRGLENPVLFLRDFHKGIKKAIKEVFPRTFSQGCLFHLCQNIYKNLPKKVEADLKERIYGVVREESPDLRKKELEELVEIYSGKYPKAVKSLMDNLEDCSAWSVLNCEFKTNNVNERNNKEDKRLIKSKETFKSIESAESILTANTLRYLSNHTLKKPADFENIQDMNRRFKALSALIDQNVLDYLKSSEIPETPPGVCTPVLWLDTLEIPYECFGQTIYVKLLICHGLKKAYHRRRFLWSCLLFNETPQELEQVLEKLNARAEKEPEIIILPADDPVLLEAVKTTFSKSRIQADLKSFMQEISDLLPEEYKDSFAECFKSAFEYNDKPEFTRQILDLIEKSLSHHHLEEALKIFVSYKSYLMTFLNIGINYFYNFKPCENLKSCLILKKEDRENNYSFFKRTLKALRNKTWDIPCVYKDEINDLFEKFNLK